MKSKFGMRDNTIKAINREFKEMNFLAHLVLSPKETDFISGNLAADFIRGSERKLISQSIQSGISMHQFVDRFTDTHMLVKTSKKRLKKHFRLLSGVLVDVFYDHFLAKDFERIAIISLEDFCEYIYDSLEKNIAQLPPRLQQFVPVMIGENTLLSYRQLDGIQTALTRINYRVVCIQLLSGPILIFHKKCPPLDRNDPLRGLK
jgi:acyl carrier protein phosphodiesterase